MSGVYLLEYSSARPHKTQPWIIHNHSKRSDWGSFAIFPLKTSIWAEELGDTILKCAPQLISDLKRENRSDMIAKGPAGPLQAFWWLQEGVEPRVETRVTGAC